MNQKTEEPSASDYDGLVRFVSWTPFIAGAVLLVLVVAYIFAFYQNGWSKNPDTWGQLGDYIGGLLNPLVAGFALLALVASVRLQKAELAATREELKESRQAMQEQAKTAEQQRNEQRFFDLLNIYKTTLDGQTELTQIAREMVRFSGKEAILRNYLEIDIKDSAFDSMISSGASLDEVRIYLKRKESVNLIFNKRDAYSRVVLLILKMIYDDFSINEKYITLFVNQLTNEELNIIAIYILISADGDNYIDIAMKTNLFLRMKDGVVLRLLQNYLLKNNY